MKRILTIGGHDPSNGAGITADHQVLQYYGILSHSVCTALTKQSHSRFEQVNWRPRTEILEQTSFLLEEYSYDGLKISVVPSISLILELIELFQEHNPSAVIIWDPVLSASVGFDFHSDFNLKDVHTILSKIYAWTPNYSEYQKLQKAIQFEHHTQLNIIHIVTSMEQDGKWFDGVFQKGKWLAMHAITESGTDKRGTGCRYGSVLLSELVLGENIAHATKKAQKAIIDYRNSSPTNEGLIFKEEYI